MRKNIARKLHLTAETLYRLVNGGATKVEEPETPITKESGYISCDGITCAVVSCAGSCFEIC